MYILCWQAPHGRCRWHQIELFLEYVCAGDSYLQVINQHYNRAGFCGLRKEK